LDEMPTSGERELEESTSSRKTGPQVKGWDHQPTVKISDPELFLSKRTIGTKNGEETKGNGLVISSTWDPAHMAALWPVTITVLTDRSLAWLSSERPNQLLTETEADRTIELKLGIPMVELGEG